MAKEGVAAVERALTVVDAFRERDHSLTLTELSRRTGFYKSTILRLADSLGKFGYLHRLDDGSFRLGPKPLLLGARLPASLPDRRRRAARAAQPRQADWRERVLLYPRWRAPRLPPPRRLASLDQGYGPRGRLASAHGGRFGPRAPRVRAGTRATSTMRSGRGFLRCRPASATRRQRQSPPRSSAPIQRLNGALTISGPRYRMEDLSSDQGASRPPPGGAGAHPSVRGKPRVFSPELQANASSYPRLWTGGRA